MIGEEVTKGNIRYKSIPNKSVLRAGAVCITNEHVHTQTCIST